MTLVPPITHASASTMLYTMNTSLFALSQITAEQAETLWSTPQFLAAVLAGFVIAIGLQMLLTNLSVALGASAAAGLDETDDSGDNKDSSSTSAGAMVRKANHAFGIWALVSGSIALFFGSWLGTELSLTVDETAGAVIGLVIWGLFYFTMLFVEKSILGSVLRTATSGLSGASQGLGVVFGKSEAKQVADTAAQVAAAVRDELLEDRRVKELSKSIGNTMERLETSFDPAELRSELETLLSRTEIEATVGDTGATDDGQVGVTASVKTRPGPSKTTLKRAGAAASKVKDIVNDERSTKKGSVDSASDAALRMTGLSKQQAAEYRDKFESYLRDTDSEALNPESLKSDLEKLFQDPRQGWAALKNRFSGTNRDTVRALLTARGVSDERAESITSWAESVLEKFSGSSDSAPSIKTRARGQLQRYLARVDDPALRYEDLRDEFEMLLDDPKAGGDALITRLKSLDRESIRSVLAARGSSSEEEAEETLRAFEEARDTVVDRAERAKLEVERRLQATKTKSLEAAEQARKTVATAAWWAFGAAAVSGVAAALGGIVAVATGIG